MQDYKPGKFPFHEEQSAYSVYGHAGRSEHRPAENPPARNFSDPGETTYFFPREKLLVGEVATPAARGAHLKKETDPAPANFLSPVARHSMDAPATALFHCRT